MTRLEEVATLGDNACRQSSGTNLVTINLSVIVATIVWSEIIRGPSCMSFSLLEAFGP